MTDDVRPIQYGTLIPVEVVPTANPWPPGAGTGQVLQPTGSQQPYLGLGGAGSYQPIDPGRTYRNYDYVVNQGTFHDYWENFAASYVETANLSLPPPNPVNVANARTYFERSTTFYNTVETLFVGVQTIARQLRDSPGEDAYVTITTGFTAPMLDMFGAIEAQLRTYAPDAVGLLAYGTYGIWDLEYPPTGVIYGYRTVVASPAFSFGADAGNKYSSRNDLLFVGTDYAHEISSGAGNDVVVALGATPIRDGAGYDHYLGFGSAVVRFDGPSDRYDLSVSSNQMYVVVTDRTSGQFDRLINVASIEFSDSTLVLNPQGSDLGQFSNSDGTTMRVVQDAIVIDAVATPYQGPAAGIRWQYLGSAAAREEITGSAASDFINGLAGDDIIFGELGNDILDGGIGSNFLRGGDGTDIFFTDARGGQVGWTTIVDFVPGVEQVTIWGYQPGVSRVFWEENFGADGYRGATAFFDMDGSSQTDRSGVDFAVTFTGHRVGQLGPVYELDGLMWFRPAV